MSCDGCVHSIQGGPCTVNKTEMICVIPPFEVNGLPSNISYTIEVGAAPGPNLTDGRLTLDVRPNPVFAEDGSAIDDNEIAAGEGGLITIRVSQCPSYHCTVCHVMTIFLCTGYQPGQCGA